MAQKICIQNKKRLEGRIFVVGKCSISPYKDKALKALEESFRCTSKWWRSGTRARLAARGVTASLRGSKERPTITRQQGRAHPTHGLLLQRRGELNPIRLQACSAACRSSSSSPDLEGGAL
jgi:hypothetical protein